MATLLLKAIRSLLQYLENACGKKNTHSDIPAICNHLYTQTDNASEIEAISVILRTRHHLVHNDKLEAIEWKELAYSLSTLDIWYRSLIRRKDPLFMSSRSLCFSVTIQWIEKEIALMEKDNIMDEEDSLSEDEEVKEEYLESDVVIRDTLYNLKSTLWKERIKGYLIRILSGKYEGKIAALKGWSGSCVRISLKSSDSNISDRISSQTLVEVLGKNYCENNRKMVHNAKLYEFFNTEWEERLLRNNVRILSGHYSSLEGSVVDINKERKEIMVAPIGDSNRITLSSGTTIALYELIPDNETSSSNTSLKADATPFILPDLSRFQ